MSYYKHRQRGTILVLILLSIAATMLVLFYVAAMPWIGIVSTILLLVTAQFFSALTIEVTDQNLSWHFGPSIFVKRVKISDITETENTRTRLWEGLGVHLTFRGWLYNVSGRGAVIIRMKTGKQFLLGTDEPGQLMAAIENACPD